jgi:hypothetical protein
MRQRIRARRNRIKRVRAEVDSIGPDNGAGLVIHGHLLKVLNGLKRDKGTLSAEYAITKVERDGRTVGEY